MSQFVVVFKKDATEQAITAHKEKLKSLGVAIGHEYNMGESFRGYSVKLPPNTTPSDPVNSFLSDPEIDYFEADGEVRIQ